MRLQIQPGVLHRSAIYPSGFPTIPSDVFERLGGIDGISRLVDGLYDGIESDPVLRIAFRDNLEHERRMQKRFFEAWFGGDRSYFDDGFHLGLKERHGKITISEEMADRWLIHCFASLAELEVDLGLVEELKGPIGRVARALVNSEASPTSRLSARSSCSTADTRPVFAAIQRDDPLEIEQLCSVHPKSIRKNGAAFILSAALRGKLQAVEALLAQGATPNIPSVPSGAEVKSLLLPDLRMTPLCGALIKRRNNIAEFLQDRGAVYDIFTASCLGDIERLEPFLRDHPEFVNIADPSSDAMHETPLLHAVLAGQTEVAKLLLRSGASINVMGTRCLQSAADTGNQELVDLLLGCGVSAGRLRAGWWVTYPEIAERLLAKGANVNRIPGRWIGISCTGNSGHREKPEFVKCLLHCGADIHAIYKGKTAMQCAETAGFTQICKLLAAASNGAKQA